MMPMPGQVRETRRESGLQPPQPASERLGHAWRLLARYWVSSEWKFAWTMLLLFVGLDFAGVYVMVRSNRWQRDFFDSIESRAAGAFLSLVTTFIAIMALQVGQILVGGIVQWWLSIRWRAWLTDRYTGRWFAADRFYEIERLRLIDNPDQRIAEDIKAITNLTMRNPITLAVGLLSSLLSAVSFGYILLETSRSISFAAFGVAVALPGDMLWYAAAYVVLGSIFITWIGKPYIRRKMREQHYEGDYRTGLIHVRRNAEQIAFAGTRDLEDQGLRDAFARIRDNWYRLMIANLGLTAGQSVYERVTMVVPLFLTVPRFFAGQISFGQVMAARDAFTQFTMSLSYFIQSYGGIAEQVANVNRLKALDDAIDLHRPRGISFGGGTEAGIALAARGLALYRPHGPPLMTVGDWTVRDGERWVVEGPSGAGKTTLLRAVAGLWPDGAGAVAMTARGRTMLVPQRLYLPLGTLKDAVCFPDRSGAHDDAVVAGLLERVRLGAHAGSMHQVRMWQEELSPGEQQRVALARILLHRPDVLVLDEATSALDADNAVHFHEALFDTMPGVTLVSVVHDVRLADFYTHRLHIDRDGAARCASLERAA